MAVRGIIGFLLMCTVLVSGASACTPHRRPRGAGAGWPQDIRWSMDAEAPAGTLPDDQSIPPAMQDTLIKNVTVIAVDGAGTGSPADVLISGGKIARIGAGKDPAGVTVVDGTGKFLIPGLWDMHSHMESAGELLQNLGWGVTGVRVMWGDASHVEWRDAIRSGARLGPRLVVASSILDGVPVSWEGSEGVADAAGAAAAVGRAREMKADFLKVYSMLGRPAFDAIAAQAKGAGMPFAGHVPYRVPVRDALAAGMRSVEHWYGIAAGCSRDEQALIARMTAELDAAQPPAGGDAQGAPNQYLWEIAGSYDAKFDDSFDPARAADLYAEMARRAVWICPTTAMLKRSGADASGGSFTESSQRAFDGEKKHLAEMLRSGVRIIAGSDEPNAGLTSGDALQEELETLVECGLSPRDALRAATLEAARCAGVDDVTGSIAVGKDADLVLLDASPLDDIRNTRQIRAVFARGTFIGADRLDVFREAGRGTGSGDGRGQQDGQEW